MKDVPDHWDDGRGEIPLGIEVTIARHGFTEFTARAHQAFVLAEWFKVIHGVANTVIKMRPVSKELIAALKAAQEPGETISVGSQSWTVERGRRIDPEEGSAP